jgi:5-methylcytosine-specific restriction endonuclease McrA
MAASRRKYTKELLSEVVARSDSVAEVLRRLDLAQAGGTHAHISRTIKALGIDTSHFGKTPRNGAEKRRHRAEQILVRLQPGSRREKPHMLHRALIEIGRPYECALCGLDGTWRGDPLRLEVDHVDGDYHNNEAWNLRFLCPNCHTQTDNFSGRSRGKYVDREGQLTLFGTLTPPSSGGAYTAPA